MNADRLKHQVHSIADLRRVAQRRLPRAVFDFVDGGAEDEKVVRRNEAALAELAFLPRPLDGTSERDQSVELFGERLSSPVLIGPTGLAGLLWPRGEAQAARAATEAGTVYTMSHASTVSIETLAHEVGGRLWMQVFLYPRPRPDADFRRTRTRRGVPGPDRDGRQSDARLARTRSAQRLHRAPAPYTRESARHGVVSNHGGRQLDAVPASVEALPAVLDAVGGKAPVLMAGGVRRGSDVLKVLSLGARACLIGRPHLWGLAAAGREGVALALEIYRREIDRVMGLCGWGRRSQVDRSVLRATMRERD